jgi:pentose-5-phosphate-3-epimerase
MKFVPTLQTESIEQFSSQYTALKPYFNEYSIDVQDGSYVPTSTIGTDEVLDFVQKTSMPQKDIFDFDIMTYDFKNALNDIEAMSKHITIRNIFIHLNLLGKNPLPTSENFAIGLALEPSDTIEKLSHYINLNNIPCIQIMTIHSGPQGQPFMKEELKKIETLIKHGYRNSIYIDGGVTRDTIPDILNQDYKPDYACVGGFLSHAGEKLVENINYLHSIERSTTSR